MSVLLDGREKMKNYMNILAAVELMQDVDEKILNKCLDMAEYGNENLHLVHIIEPINAPPPFLDSREEYEANIRSKVSELGDRFAIPEKNRFVIVGNIEEEIFDLLEAIDADLLVVGNHGRHGVQALFRSNHTTRLLKDTDCDMLAVRVA